MAYSFSCLFQMKDFSRSHVTYTVNVAVSETLHDRVAVTTDYW